MGDVLSTDDKYTVSSVEGSLVVHSVTAADEGDYVCSAANSHSTATASAFLQPLCECSVSVCVLLRVNVCSGFGTLS